jgi:hypothetical protein
LAPHTVMEMYFAKVSKKILGKHYIESDKDVSPNDVIIEANLELIYVC